MTAEKQVLLYELTRKEFRTRLEGGEIKAAIVPTGSTEQHLKHLAMIHDTASALHVAKEVALRLFPKVVVTTPLAIGVSEHWMDFKGTLTVRDETLQSLLYDVCLSLKRHGVRVILVLNGHAGNAPAIRDYTSDLARRIACKMRFHSYWELIPRGTAESILESGRWPAHAQEFETSIALSAFPHRVRREDVEDEQAKLATDEKGKALIDAAVKGTVEVLQEMMS